MKRVMAALLMCIAGTGLVQAQDAKPEALLYISPVEYTHEVRLGLVPMYIVWSRKGPALELAARRAFEGAFGRVGMCEGNNGADVIVWLQSALSYNPTFSTYYAQVTARFFRADGKAIGVVKGSGKYYGAMGSTMIEHSVQGAYHQALQSIAAQYTTDATLQGKIDASLPQSPCALVALVPHL
jgi:hypothetical protein